MLSADDKSKIGDVTVSSGITFKTGSGMLQTRTVTFSFNGKGPFSRAFPLAEYTPENVTAWQEQEINTLRQIGAA